MRRILLIFLGIILVSQNARGEEQKLSQAYEDQLLERVKSVFSTEIPQKAIEHPICATPIFVEINFNKPRFSPKMRAYLEPYISRPTFGGSQEYTYDTPGGNIKLHYAKTGTDAVFQANVDVNPLDGVPDYVNRCADIFDSVWNKEVNMMGYNPPPSDNWYQPNGGDGKYDVYLKVPLGNYYGYTVPESSYTSNSTSYTSYIVVLNDYTGRCYNHDDPIDCLRVTAAHEFFHAIQFGYDASEFEYTDPNDIDTYKQYWMEMSAVWMEDQVYDGVNDYLNYLRYFFGHPDWSLKTFGGSGDGILFPYGACVWPIYLSERKYPSKPVGFDTSIIKDIWIECAKCQGPNFLNSPIDCQGITEPAIDIVLNARGITFEEAFREFTVWNYFTADRARTQIFYSEGNLFPKVKVDSSYHFHTVYPVINSTSLPNPPYGLGSNYIIFKPQEEQGGLQFSFMPTDYFKLSAMGYNENVNEPIRDSIQINPETSEASAAIYNWTSYNEIIVIPAATSRDGSVNFTYYYSADYDSSYHGEQPFPQKDWIGQNFPNPFVIQADTGSTSFPFILASVSQVKIDIFTVSGEKVWHYPPAGKEGQDWTIGNYTERGSCPAWDGKNDKGEYVASGIYLYQVKTKNSSVIKKLAVVR
jgi:hypothetical protein